MPDGMTWLAHTLSGAMNAALVLAWCMIWMVVP